MLLATTCGLEDYPYIYPVPQSNITQSLNNRAVVRIPTNNNGPPFTHYVIFYRIYVSDIDIPSTTRDSYTRINSALASDYNYVYPYIDSDTLINTNMDNLFERRYYKYLYLRGDSIDRVLSLSSSIAGSTLVFDFASGKEPTMTKGSIVYTLQRSNGNGLFSPRPDRRFINSSELSDSDNINVNTNADVVNKSGISPGNRYTYAAMFIAAVGINNNTYSPIYSTPSLIHVFRLPDTW